MTCCIFFRFNCTGHADLGGTTLLLDEEQRGLERGVRLFRM